MFALSKIENVELDEQGNFYFDLGLLWDSDEGEAAFEGSLSVYKNNIKLDYSLISDTGIIAYRDGFQYKTYCIKDIKVLDFIKIIYSFDGQQDAIDLYLNQHEIFDVCSCDLITVTSLWIGDIIKMKIEALELYSNELCCNCDIPLNFLNRVLQIIALEYAVQSENTELIDEMSCIINGINATTKEKGCGCHGN